MYTDGLLDKLPNAGVGCFFGSYFVGALAYVYGLVLLVPTPTAMRQLLSICGECGKEFSIKFNAMKSKWLAVVPRKRRWLSFSARCMSVPDGCLSCRWSFVISTPWSYNKF